MPGTKSSLISENGKKWKEFLWALWGREEAVGRPRESSMEFSMNSTRIPCFYSFHILGFWARLWTIRRVLLLEKKKSDDHSSSVKSTFYKWRDYVVKRGHDFMQGVQRTSPVLPPFLWELGSQVPSRLGKCSSSQSWKHRKIRAVKKKNKGFITQRGFIPISALSLAEHQKVNS